MIRFYLFLRSLLSRDPGERFQALTQIGRCLVPKYRFKWPQMAWWDDQKFSRYLDRFGELDGMNTDRHWMLYQLLRFVEAVPGDTCEAGVYRGASSCLMCHFAHSSRTQPRVHRMFDSFEGLSAPSEADGSHWKPGALACSLEDVQNNLAEFPNVSYHKGWIPERFPDVADCRFAFLHIDVDLYEPTRDTIEYFYPRMNPGGIIFCDDYGFTTCPGATRAIDEFLADKPEKMIQLSCGGGFLIRGTPTSDEFLQ